jgi:hypothetical protein
MIKEGLKMDRKEKLKALGYLYNLAINHNDSLKEFYKTNNALSKRLKED